MKRNHIRRLGAAFIAPALAFGAIAGTTQAAQANTSQARAGADWLVDQLTDGLLHNPNYGGFDDYGLSADALFALASVGGYGAEVNQISSALASNAANYIGDGTAEAYSGSTAKLLVVAETARKDPTAFGGVNLVTRLEGLVTNAPSPVPGVLPVGAADGRIADVSAYGDYANTFGQSFAAQGLKGATSATKTAQVTSYLLKQQCAEGYFRLNFNDQATNAAQTCDAGDHATTSAPNPDATAIALKALLAQAGSPAIDTAIAHAADWLIAHQGSDGSFGGGATTEAPNANSTGLAGWALGLAGKDEAAAKAASWVFDFQASTLSTCGTKLATERGAVAYNAESLAAGRTDGITDGTSDQWRRTTVEAVPALVNFAAPARLPAAALTVTGPSTFVRSGSTVHVSVAGLAAGESYCPTGVGTVAGGTANSEGAATFDVKLPTSTANSVVTVTGSNAGRTGSATIKGLAAKTLWPRVSTSSIRRGHTQTVSVAGLAPFEPLHITYRGTTLKVSKASSTGTYRYSFNVGHSKGYKTVHVIGAFSNRAGSKTFKVT